MQYMIRMSESQREALQRLADTSGAESGAEVIRRWIEAGTDAPCA